MVMVVNTDPHETRSGMVHLDLVELGLDPHEPFEVHDLLGDARYRWQGPDNYVELDPAVMPAHVFHIGPIAEIA